MENPNVIWQRERVTSFFNSLTTEQKKFTDAPSVHDYLVKTLAATERAHNARGHEMMIAGFRTFGFDTTYNIWHHATLKQVILIHFNGAYAIYDNKENKEFNVWPLVYYKEKSEKCIISVPNVRGQTIWDPQRTSTISSKRRDIFIEK